MATVETLARATFAWHLRGQVVPVDLRPLTSVEIRDAQLAAEVLVRACVDSESPLDAPEPFFTSSDEAITLVSFELADLPQQQQDAARDALDSLVRTVQSLR